AACLRLGARVRFAGGPRPCECAVEIGRVPEPAEYATLSPEHEDYPASPDRAPMSFPHGAGLYAGDRLTGGWHHAETDLRHERDPGRLHRRARRRHRVERAAERRAVPVVARPGAGERPVAVRAQAMGDDELLLADRRPAAQRNPGGDRVRTQLAGHAEGGVLLDDRRD